MEWPIVKLNDITEVVTKGTTPTSVGFKFIPEGINFVKVESITSEGRFLPQKFAAISEECNESLKRSQLKEGDVLFSIAGALGRTALVTSKILPANTNQALAIIRLKAGLEIDKHFLLLALTTSVTIDQVEKSKGGVAQQNLSLGQLKGFEIPLPSILEQKRIVAILDQAFADIEQARAKTEQNLKNARELFESYLQQVFSQRGDGWEVSKLVDVAKVIDSLHKTPKYSEGGYPMVRVTDVRPGPLDLSNTRKVDKDTFEEFSKKYKAKIGDIVFSRVGSYGRSSIVTTNEEFCLGQNTVFLAPSMDGYYFYYFLNSKYAKDQIDKLVSGSTQPTVSLKSIKAINVPIPPKSEQLAIVKKLDEMHIETARVEATYNNKLEKLDELKKSILQKAFSGELTKPLDGDAHKGAAA